MSPELAAGGSCDGVIITTLSGDSLDFFDGDMTTPACWPFEMAEAACFVAIFIWLDE